MGARHHMGRRGSDGVSSGVGEGSFADADGISGDIDVVAAAFAF